jgi:hypothetical protein
MKEASPVWHETAMGFESLLVVGEALRKACLKARLYAERDVPAAVCCKERI